MQESNSQSERGLICEIYRDSGRDCSNGGISGRVNAVTLIGLGPDCGIFEPVADRPAVRIIKRKFAGQVYLHAEPVDQPEGLVGPMAGGTFIYSCDSRFPSQYPIALHDRWETVETYNMLSR